MYKILRQFDFKSPGWITGEIHCAKCRHSWLGTSQLGSSALECPACGEFAGFRDMTDPINDRRCWLFRKFEMVKFITVWAFAFGLGLWTLANPPYYFVLVAVCVLVFGVKGYFDARRNPN